MEISITYWKEKDGMFLGYLNDYPDHWTQGVDLQDLKEHLKDLYHAEMNEILAKKIIQSLTK